MGIQTYAPDKVSVTVGILQICGFSPNSVVKVTRDEDSFTKRVGADGKVTRTRSANRAGKVEITLAQSSPSNLGLSLLQRADEDLNVVNTAYFPIVVVDHSTGTIHECTNCWISAQPEDDYTNEAGDRTWVLDCASIDTQFNVLTTQ